jgi:hypothetical protein
MGSFKHPRVFDPLDLEIIDRVTKLLGLRSKLVTLSATPTMTAIDRRLCANSYLPALAVDRLCDTVIARLARLKFAGSARSL